MINRNNIILGIICLIIQQHSFAQTIEKEGKIQVIQSPQIDSLVQLHIAYNAQKTTQPGYRLQIYFGNQRMKANDAKTNFLMKFPDENVYLIYQHPNYKVRVGDFKTRLEAYRFYKMIHPDFGSTFIVRDDIRKRGN
jgi:hypothetical protein